MTGTINGLTPRFVEFIPKELKPGLLYISIEYTTTAHQCACGCGEKVILPLHPTDWRLTFDGKSITMWPSVGNWGFPCRSHYMITNNRIEWASSWTESQIEFGRRCDAVRRKSWHAKPTGDHKKVSAGNGRPMRRSGWFGQLFSRLVGPRK